MSRGANTVTIMANTAEIDAYLDQISDGLGKSTQPVAKAGAEVLYDEVRLNAQGLSSGKGHWFHGSQFKKTGKKYWIAPFNLRDSIYHVYSKGITWQSKTIKFSNESIKTLFGVV
jgi:hypothetical protein